MTDTADRKETPLERSSRLAQASSRLQGMFIWIGIAHGDSDLYFWDDPDDAVKFLQGDPARNDPGATGPTRRVFQAQLSTVSPVHLLKPIPARLATPSSFSKQLGADPDNWKGNS